MLYPYVPITVPPCCLRNNPAPVLTGYLGSTLPSSEANMFVYGCVPHSGPSEKFPVTGTPCCWGYLAAAKNSALSDTMPRAPLEMASCTAVTTVVGLVSSLITKGTILCPLMPP